MRTGPAAHEITQAAAHNASSLIVMATHGRGGLQRALLATGGSYALPNPYPDGWRNEELLERAWKVVTVAASRWVGLADGTSEAVLRSAPVVGVAALGVFALHRLSTQAHAREPDSA